MTNLMIINASRGSIQKYESLKVNRLTPNDPYMGRTAPLTSKRCILYICSTNIGTENFKHALYSPFFSLQNVVCFIMLTCLVPILFTFYIQGVLKLKKNNSGAKGLILWPHPRVDFQSVNFLPDFLQPKTFARSSFAFAPISMIILISLIWLLCQYLTKTENNAAVHSTLT